MSGLLIERKRRARRRSTSREPLSLFPNEPRWCPDCSRFLPRDSFNRKTGTRDGLYSYCRECDHLRMRKRLYGKDIDFDRMVEAQGNSCAICNKDMGTGLHRHVDHCHDTGLIRGLLCDKCNLLIGYAKDDPKRLLAAAAHMEKYMAPEMINWWHRLMPTEPAKKRSRRLISREKLTLFPETLRQCSYCLRYLSLDSFSRKANSRDGLSSHCQECACAREVKRTYGLAPIEYKVIVAAQENKCGMCAQPETNTYRGRLRRLAVDHCHITGRVRGVLCTTCNNLIDYSEEDPTRIREAADYLMRKGRMQT